MHLLPLPPGGQDQAGERAGGEEAVSIAVRAMAVFFGWMALTMLASLVSSAAICLATGGHVAGLVFCLVANGYLGLLGSRAGFEAVDEVLQGDGQ